MINPEQLLVAIKAQCDVENVTENAYSVIGVVDLEELASTLNQGTDNV